MQQFLEAVGLALQAIWANKLRSLLTVLGNIVAVTSIIAVVSLVQGLNASVTDMIQTQFAPDAFTVSRTGMARTDEEQLRVQSNPRITMNDADAVREAGPTIALVMAETQAGGQIKYRGTSIDSVQLRGVTKEVVLESEGLSPAVKDPWGGLRRGFMGMTKINRKDFGTTFNKLLDNGGAVVSDEVAIEIEAELKGEAPKEKKG